MTAARKGRGINKHRGGCAKTTRITSVTANPEGSREERRAAKRLAAREAKRAKNNPEN